MEIDGQLFLMHRRGEKIDGQLFFKESDSQLFFYRKCRPIIFCKERDGQLFLIMAELKKSAFK